MTRNYTQLAPGTGPCKNCQGTGISKIPDYCFEGYAAPEVLELRKPLKLDNNQKEIKKIRGAFVYRCQTCNQFEDNLDAANYLFNNPQIIKCGCGVFHVVVNRHDRKPLPEEVIHTYSATIEVAVDMHPLDLICDEERLKAAILKIAVDRIEAGTYDPQDLTNFELIEERVIE